VSNGENIAAATAPGHDWILRGHLASVAYSAHGLNVERTASIRGSLHTVQHVHDNNESIMKAIHVQGYARREACKNTRNLKNK